ncbi:MAG: zinc ribbon domain-containing protein [Nanoarchaeota archaeon]
MFRNKCGRCGKSIRKSYEFCPSCGSGLGKENIADYGFLGKNDINDLNMKLPFGFNMLFKPLLKELQKQMLELDQELKKETKDGKKSSISNTGFSIHIKAPGQKPIRLTANKFPGMISQNNVLGKDKDVNVQNLVLPRISKDLIDKSKDFPRKEPETSVRRLADKIVYELSIPGVSSLSGINIRQLDSAFEVKAVAKKEVYNKSISLNLPLANYFLANEKLVLEFLNE